MITFKKESFTQLMEELPPLFHEHWLEVARDKKAIPLDMDWKRYIEMDAMGQLHTMTVREDGILVGYFVAIVWTHLHYKTSLTAWSDIFYLHPAYRSGWTGYKLFVHVEAMLKTLGVQKSYVMTKAHLPINIIMKRLKYRLVERVFTKLL